MEPTHAKGILSYRAHRQIHIRLWILQTAKVFQIQCWPVGMPEKIYNKRHKYFWKLLTTIVVALGIYFNNENMEIKLIQAGFSPTICLAICGELYTNWAILSLWSHSPSMSDAHHLNQLTLKLRQVVILYRLWVLSEHYLYKPIIILGQANILERTNAKYIE